MGSYWQEQTDWPVTGSVTSGRPPSQQEVEGGEGTAFVTPLGDADPLIPPPDEVGDPNN